MPGHWGDGALYGGGFVEVRPPVCRKSWCSTPALTTRDDGLCHEHGVEQDWLRTEVALAAEEMGSGRGRHNGPRAGEHYMEA